MAQSPTKSCALCDKPATLYCYEDKQFLCSQCRKDIHDRVTVCRDHNVVDIHKAGNRIYKPVPVCDSHKKEFLYYCSKCDCLACKECMTSSHNGHITKEIKSITDIHRQEVDEIINKLKTKVEELTKTLEIIDGEHSLLIQSGCDSYIEVVEKTSAEIHHIIDHYKQIEMNTAFDFRDTETHNLTGTRVFFQRFHKESSDRMLKFENLLQEPHDNTFFLEWKNLQNEYKIMTEESEPHLSSPRQMSGFNQDTFRRAIIDGIDKQFQIRLKELETTVAVLIEEVDTLNVKMKGKQEEIDNLSELSQELQLKEKKETSLLDEINKLKTEIKDQDQRIALQKEKETAVARLTDEMDVLKEKLKMKQEQMDKLSKLSEELQLKERKEIELLDENNKLKTEIKERNVREVKFQEEQEKTVARLTDKIRLHTENLTVKQGQIDNLTKMRIVLIGCTGAGKSSLGNTLLGENCFYTSAGETSATLKCEIRERIVGNRKIKVVDTPPIIDSEGENMVSTLARFFDLLSPGPHAIIIVIPPSTGSNIERRTIEILFDFFGDDYFLDFTMLVVVRKCDIIGEFGEWDNIYDFVENKSSETIRQLYEKCNKRIVAVENRQTFTNREKDAERVFEEIDKIDGYYSQRYFQKLTDEKRNYEVIAKLEKSIKTKEQEKEELKNRSNCKQM
ncbi:myosin-9-like [Mytilus edulis]|uniref:myosin-9-like n=1 Tax=Mytilus edulis TaxID=6550 RepID=UPI0039EF24F1